MQKVWGLWVDIATQAQESSPTIEIGLLEHLIVSFVCVTPRRQSVTALCNVEFAVSIPIIPRDSSPAHANIYYY